MSIAAIAITISVKRIYCLSKVIKKVDLPCYYQILNPSNQKASDSYQYLLSYPILKKTTMILYQFKIVLLVSIVQLCNNNCYVLLNKRILYAFRQSQIILRGNRNNSDGLWDILVQNKVYFQKVMHYPYHILVYKK